MKVTAPCTCPPKANGEPRHETDTFVFRDRLDLEAGLAIRKSIPMMKMDDPGSGAAEVLAVMSVQYIVHGIESWSRVDDKGKPIEVTKTSVREFMNDHDDIVADYLVDEADNLYAERHLLPLVRAAQTSSPPSQTEPSTSAPIGSEETPPKRSRRSSTSTTRTDGTATITSLPVGDSNTSARSA